MQNEPQLSAEMEKRFEKIKHKKCDECGVMEPDYEAIKHFLATALEEQRASMIAEIESWLVDEEYPITDPDSIDYGKMLASPKNEWNEELRAKLVEISSNP